MAIKVSQAFERTSANPIDVTLTLTKAQMKTVNDNLMPAYYFTIGQDDGQLYLYDKTNDVDETTGKFRLFEGGSSDYSALDNKPSVNSVTLSGNKTSSDLGLQDIIQLSTMPTAVSAYLGKVVQFIGTSDATYTKGYFYECVSDGQAEPTYSWTQKNVQPSEGGGTSDYSELTNKPSVNSVTLSGNKTSADLGLQDVIQVTELPTASASNEGRVYQYLGVTGTYTSGYFYRCESDGESTPTYSWVQLSVQPSGGSGNASLESAVTSNLKVGAIESGTTLAQGTTFTEFVQKLLITEIAPTVTFSASGSGVKEVGTSVTPTLTLTITANGTGTPTSIKFYDGSTLLDTQTYASGTNTYTYTMSAVTTTKTVKGVLEYTKSDGTTSASVEKSATYTFVMASYYGAVATAPTDKAGITALTKNVKNSKGQTATFNLNNQRSCYCYPASMGDLTSIKDANNFEYLASYTKTNVTVDEVSYNVYTLTDPVTATGFKQVYA